MKEAIILAGGLGTRLATVIPDLCKPMAPVMGKPFIEYIIRYLSKQGFEKIILSVGYKSDLIKEYFGDKYKNVELVYSVEERPLLTGGAIKQALTKCESEYVYVFNGDSLCLFDYSVLNKFILELKDSRMKVCVVAKFMNNFDRYGSLEVVDGNRVIQFNEKKYCKEGLINVGIYIIKHDAMIDSNEKFSLENDWLPQLTKQNGVFACVIDGKFIDIGIPADYLRADSFIKRFYV